MRTRELRINRDREEGSVWIRNVFARARILNGCANVHDNDAAGFLGDEQSTVGRKCEVGGIREAIRDKIGVTAA
jgi:hypothetical protein